jgi:uncharacterized protein YecT (DUF1311 family)
MMPLLLMAAWVPCAHAQTQIAMNACATAEEKRADAGLNRQWSITYAAMKRRDAAERPRGGPGHAAALLASQRAWLQFRDRQCFVEGLAAYGGSIRPLVVAQCRTAITQNRTGQLAVLSKALA